MVGRQEGKGSEMVKWLLIAVLLGAAVSSQNILPIHIAFIPLLVPPLLYVMGRLQLDRRLIACVLTFGLITPYMFLPVGFGGIFLKEVLLANVAKGGVDVSGLSVMQAMMIPAAGMLFGLLVAILFTYRKKRVYQLVEEGEVGSASSSYSPKSLIAAGAAVVAAFVVQLWLDSMIMGALVGFVVFSVSGVVRWKEAGEPASPKAPAVPTILTIASGLKPSCKAKGTKIAAIIGTVENDEPMPIVTSKPTSSINNAPIALLSPITDTDESTKV